MEDGLCIRSCDFSRLRQWPPGSRANLCTLSNGRVSFPSGAKLVLEVTLDNVLSDRTLVVEITLPNRGSSKLFEATLQVEGDRNDLRESLVLGEPFGERWSFVCPATGPPVKLSTEKETNWADRKSLKFVLNAKDAQVSCWEDGVLLKTPVGIQGVRAFPADTDLQIVLCNHGQDYMVVHKVELWGTAAPVSASLAGSMAILANVPAAEPSNLGTSEASAIASASSPGLPGISEQNPAAPATTATTAPALPPPPLDQLRTGPSIPSKTPPPSQSTGTVAAETLDPKLAAHLPPGWGPGVKYVTMDWQPLEVPAHDLPAPTFNGTPLHSMKTGWNPPPGKARSIPIQVDFDTIVYEADDRKYLVVAAQLSSGGAMVDTIYSSKGKRCGYYQKGIQITIHPQILDKPITLNRVEKGIFPRNNIGDPLNVKTGSEKGSSSTAGFKIEPTFNPVVGTITVAGVNASYVRGRKHADEVSGVKREWLELPYTATGAKLTWTGQLGAFKDGTSYADGKAKGRNGKLLDVPEFAKANQGVDVQGTWQLPVDYKGALLLKFEVQQVLCYSGLVGRVKPTVETYEDTIAKGSFEKLVQTDLSGATAKVCADIKPPFW